MTAIPLGATRDDGGAGPAVFTGPSPHGATP